MGSLHFFLAKGLPHVSSPPPPGSPGAYNENEIVGLVTKIYQLMVALCYLNPHEVVYPPADSGRHAMNTGLFREVGMNAQVISLLERLPHLRLDFEVDLLTWSGPVDYFHDIAIQRCRFPHDDWNPYGEERPPPDLLGPAEAVLWMRSNPEGDTLVIDTEASEWRA
jgi:hypothetical protein